MWTAIVTRAPHPGVTIDVLSDVWTGSLISIPTEELAIDVRADVWIDALADVLINDMTIVAASGIGVDMLVDADANVLAAVRAAWTFIVPAPLPDSVPFCWAASSCWPIADLGCARALQALIPSCQVWPSFALTAPPQVLNQEPPWPQQLLFPDFSMVPHLEHTEPTIVVVAAGVWMRALIKDTKRKILSYSLFSLSEMCVYMISNIELTFTGLEALRPLVTNVSVDWSSAVRIPSTARSAATGSTGFQERATLWARHRFSDHWGDSWGADWRSHWGVCY